MKLVKTLSLAAMLAVGHTATGAIVFSDDFESPDVTAGQSDGNTSGAIDSAKWQKASQGFGSGRQGTVDEAHGDFTDPGGEQAYAFRYTNSGITTKAGLLGTAVAGTVFTVTFDIVVDGHNNGDDYFVGFVTFNGGARNDMRPLGKNATSILATKSGTASGSNYEQVTLSYTIDAVDDAAVIGHDVALQFDGATDTAIIDNVEVDVVVPEPGSLALLGLGSLLMASRRRR